MKKRYLKSWVEKLLIIISFITILILSSEVEDSKLFITSKFICIVILIINYYVFSKYSKNFNKKALKKY